MRTFFAVSATLAVITQAVDLSSGSEVSAETTAMANAAMINDYILAQVERMNSEADEFA